MFHGYGMHGWGMGWGWIIGLMALLALIWIIVKVADQNRKSTRPSDRTPLDILNERYARGEIDKDEFEEKKKDLGS